MLAYNELVLPVAKQTSKWILVVDLDEFVYSPRGIMFPDLLDRYRYVSGISSPWVFFGSNGHIKQPLSVLNGFTKRMSYIRGQSVNVKNFYQTQFVKRLYPHHAEFTEPHHCTISSKSHAVIQGGKDIVYESDINEDRLCFWTNQ